MEFKAVNYIFPEWNVWQQFVYSVQGLAFDRDGMKTTHPVEQEVGVFSPCFLKSLLFKMMVQILPQVTSMRQICF